MLVAAALLRRLMRRGSPLASIAGVTGMLVAIADGTMISAIVGPISLTLAGVFKVGSLPEVIRTWWLGDLCGALVVVPLALAWHPLPRRRFRHLACSSRGSCWSRSWLPSSAIGAVSHDPLLYLVFPALMWSAVRLGARGATLAVAVAVGITIWATTHHEGAFVFHSITHSVISAQLFIAVAALSTLFLTALVSEREAFAVRLGESRAQLYRAAETERLRIERNLHDGAQQRLLALGVRLRLATARAESADPWIPTAFASAEGELSAALDDLRDLSRGTHPSVLTELGLADALKSVAARSAIPVTALELPETEVDLAAEEAAFFFVVEAVANAQKHSAAESIRIGAAFAGGTLWLEVVDDGVGGVDERTGSGLRGLRERVEALDGTFRCDSPPGRGTTIAAAIPASAA